MKSPCLIIKPRSGCLCIIMHGLGWVRGLKISYPVSGLNISKHFTVVVDIREIFCLAGDSWRIGVNLTNGSTNMHIRASIHAE